MNARIRVLLADDHPVVRAGFKALVAANDDLTIVAEAVDGQQAITLALELMPQVVVMDISMPNADGFVAMRDLKQRAPSIALIAFSIHEEAGYFREALDAGASGYVLKRAEADELLQAVRSVAAGGVYFDRRLTDALTSRGSQLKAVPHQGGDDLSDREREVLIAIARGYSNKEIAGELELSVKTVETYKARSMEKLGLRSRVDIVRYAGQREWLK